MHIAFGLALDARQGPSAAAALDAPILGPKGFLALLETYLGLAAPEVDPVATGPVARREGMTEISG